MDAQALRLSIIVGAAVFLIGCITTPPPQAGHPASAESSASQPAQATQQPSAKSAAPPAQSPSLEKAVPQASEAAKPAPEVPSSNGLVKKGEIQVTKEEYRKTFDDVHRLIDELNRIIASRDYAAWIGHLTANYVRTYSDPKTLNEISDQPMLKRDNLHLASLKDYFFDVVVPSRANARLDDLDFVSKTHVKAITIIEGQRYILYDLQFVDGSWKIGVS